MEQSKPIENLGKGGEGGHATPLASLAVAERLDFLRQAVLFLDRDPLEHLEPLLQHRHFFAQPSRLLRVCGFAAHLAHRAHRNSHLVPNDAEDEHHRYQNQNKFGTIHRVSSSVRMRSCSRSASICAAVSTPRSVAIFSSTRSRASIRSTC